MARPRMTQRQSTQTGLAAMLCYYLKNILNNGKKTIAVIGMACAGMQQPNVERRLNELNGISSAAVNFAARTALVEYDPKVITPQMMKDEIIKAGYDLVN